MRSKLHVFSRFGRMLQGGFGGLWAAGLLPWLGCDVTGDVGTPKYCMADALQSLQCPGAASDPAQPAGCGSDCLPLTPATVGDALAKVAGFSTSQLLSRYPTQFGGALTYDPLSAKNLDRIQQSSLALSSEEQQILTQHGFVLSQRQRFSSFASGYAQLYMQHMPVYVSADSILHALHRSYDEMLTDIESEYLHAEVATWLDALRTRIVGGGAAGFSSSVRTEVDVYLATALSLLRGYTHSPIEPDAKSAQAIATWVKLAEAASGPSEVPLFGTSVLVDFSQFRPRGHYTQSTQLERYFRCLMWLANAELRIVEQLGSAPPKVNRQALEAAELLHDLHDDTAWQSRRHIDALLQLFVGEEDQLTVEQMTKLLAQLGVRGPADLALRSDAQIVAALMQGGFGVQRIVSQILIGDTQVRSFMLLGQRFVPDSQVLSNVVYSRAGGGTIPRFLPSPLDVAFAALGNNHAATLLQDEMRKFPYAADLAKARVLSDGYGDEFWQSNLYRGWLRALRTLSPDESRAAPARFGLPQATGSEAWARRLLNTQLGSWAQLRHDTILYAKPSTSSFICEFPDAYVDPYPAFYRALIALGDRATSELRGLASPAPVVQKASGYFEHLSEVARMLEEMAELQRQKRPFADRHLAFINELVRVSLGCTGFFAPGWYLKLFWNQKQANQDIPTIADVHTDPNTGTVLHVATGLPQLLVVSLDTCQGIRAYAGLAFSYHEILGAGFHRYTDEEWYPMARKGAALPAWLQGLSSP
ncbi:MAG: DUF3160 domain-containing protein [Myxococcales bacterium]|nr:DUF3160 domain-containing protein [Myxococcales bacterium]